ncbi:MAG: tRNA pseudouridine(55) synthase TruB [Elusimicrobia bacterium]|nr:tRNA pseudouridine(55) synthase TruB [Elusimicrobiota bacterium]
MNGIVNINKPQGCSSFDVVRKIRGFSGVRKVGHGGTLDPQAEGVLLILMGEACKAFDFFMNKRKEYIATIRLGFVSDTWDASGNIEEKEAPRIKREDIIPVLENFKGEYVHRVPDYSAKKTGGKAFYRLKRRGITPPKKEQRSMIYEIELLGYSSPDLTFRVICSSGTYIRTLAIDISERFDNHGYLAHLKRTMINDFKISDAVRPEKNSWKDGFTDINRIMLAHPYIVISEEAARGLSNGIIFREADITEKKGDIHEGIFGVFSPGLTLKALSEKEGDEYKLRRVLNIPR